MAAAAFPARVVAWRSALIIFLLAAIASADRFAISILIGPIKNDFGIGDFQASLLIGAAFTSFYILFLVPIGWAADRYPRRKVLAACLAIWSLATIACGWMWGFVVLFAARMVVGAGEAGMAPTTHGIIGDSFEKAALAKPLAMQGIGFQVGSAAGIAAAGAILAASTAGSFRGWPIIGDIAGWRVAFFMIGLPGIIALALIPLIHDPKELRNVGEISAPIPFLPFFRENKAIMTLVLVFGGVSSVGLACCASWLAEYLQRTHGIPVLQTGAMLGGYLLIAAVVGQGVYAIISDYFSTRGIKDAPIRVGIIPIALSIPLAWMAFSPDNSAKAWLFPMLLALAPCNAITNTTAQLVVPAELRSRMAAAVILSVSLIGFTIGPALVGWVSQYWVGETNLGLALRGVIVGAMAVSLLLMVALGPRLAVHLGQR